MDDMISILDRNPINQQGSPGVFSNYRLSEMDKHQHPLRYALNKRSPHTSFISELDLPLAKRLIMSAMTNHNDMSTNRKLLDWLTEAKSRELFSNYGKRLSDILQSAKYSGHQAWFSGYGKRNGDVAQSNNLPSSPQNAAFSIDPIKQILGKNDRVFPSGIGKRNSYQGHQAWFSGYGKRQDKGYQGHQAWFSGYGKRKDSGYQGHQAWFSGYGKRSDSGYQGHQAWFSGYGKRPSNGYQGHQAWFSGYGKRAYNEKVELEPLHVLINRNIESYPEVDGYYDVVSPE
ncbi:hypothetical protein SNE40_006638 [Patella caerulea]